MNSGHGFSEGGEVPEVNKRTLDCTLSDDELIKKGKEWIGKLCNSGGRDWMLHIPARPNEDPDLIFSELVTRFQKTKQPPQ